VPGRLWVKWSSAIVGPAATVTTYDFEQFKNATAVLRPGLVRHCAVASPAPWLAEDLL